MPRPGTCLVRRLAVVGPAAENPADRADVASSVGGPGRAGRSTVGAAVVKRVTVVSIDAVSRARGGGGEGRGVREATTRFSTVADERVALETATRRGSSLGVSANFGCSVGLANQCVTAAEPPPGQRRRRPGRLLSLARVKIQPWSWRVVRLLNQVLRCDVLLLLLLSPDEWLTTRLQPCHRNEPSRPTGISPLVVLRSTVTQPRRPSCLS